MSFQPGDDNFGIISNDPPAMAEADRIYFYVKRRLGDDIVNVELTELEIFTALENAILEFSKVVNEYNNKSNLSVLLGTGTGSLSGLENSYIYPDLSNEIMNAEKYASEAGVGGYDRTFLGNFLTIPGQQTYRLQEVLSASFQEHYGHPPQKIRVVELFWVDPANAYTPWGGMDQFGFGGGLGGYANTGGIYTQYQIMPIFDTVLRKSMFKQAIDVRLSKFSFNILGGDLILYPVPTGQYNLWLRYREANDPFPIGKEFFTGSTNTSYTNPMAHSISGVSNPANAPFGVIPWSRINSIGQQWIRSFAFALCKETLGYVRRKYKSGIPVPGDSSVNLDGDDMVSEGIAEQTRLQEQIRTLFDELTYDKLDEKNAARAESLNKSLGYVPLGIYIG